MTSVSTFYKKVRGISDSFINGQPSKNNLSPDYPTFPVSRSIEMYHEQRLSILCKVNETNCANDPFHIRNAISTPPAKKITHIVNSSFLTGVFLSRKHKLLWSHQSKLVRVRMNFRHTDLYITLHYHSIKAAGNNLPQTSEIAFVYKSITSKNAICLQTQSSCWNSRYISIYPPYNW